MFCNPALDLASSLEEWMDQTVEETLRAVSPQVVSTGTLAPLVDCYEDADQLVLKIESPGLTEKDLDVTLEGNVLTVRGERRLEDGEKKGAFTWIERPYGTFVRSFTLPNTVDPNIITANYTNGVLEIALAKRAEAKPKQIPVTVGQKTLPTQAAA
jgi:HSP20 family protein